MNFLNKWIYGDLFLTNKYKYCFNFVEQFQGRVGHSSQQVAGKNNEVKGTACPPSNVLGNLSLSIKTRYFY